MVEVDVLVKNVEATRLTEGARDDVPVTFDVSASLTETEREPGQISLKFGISIAAQPPVAKIEVGGTAKVTGEEAEIESILTVKDQDSTPPIFMTIYQKVYAVLYLLSGSLKIPYPSPGLMKVVKLASQSEVPPPSPAKPAPISA
jgi:hypothetical protein